MYFLVPQSIQGLQSRRNVRRRDGSRRVSKLHMVVDIRDSVIRPRALKEHRDRFYFGNAVIAVRKPTPSDEPPT